MEFDTSLISSLEDEITELVKDEIKRQDLIDTGLMLNSVETTITPNDTGMTILVTSTDYFKYVDGTYDVLDNAFGGSEYDRIISSLENIYKDAIENSFGL